MTTIALSYQKVQKNIQAKIDSIEIPLINWKAICLIGLFLGIMLLVFYVYQVNSLTAGSYLITSYEKQINKLSQENKNLEISFAESSFLGQALAKIQAMNFQKTTAVRYIQILDSTAQVAKSDKKF
jgi:hypothetical protein